MKRFNIIFVLALSLAVASCNEWLNVMPDNRAEVDSVEKVAKLLVSAYPENDYIVLTHLMSDDVDEMQAKKAYTKRFYDQIYSWDNITETDNDDPKQVWSALYSAVANANQALYAINEMGNGEEFAPYRGEALMCRAYAHLILAQLFCESYDPQTAFNKLGLPYMEEPEMELFPKYERGNLADFYAKIGKDIEEGLPLVNDNIYSVPKYHFNKNAAYTLASRYYLVTGQWDKVIECSSAVLGSAPATMLRNFDVISALPTDEFFEAMPYQWNSTSAKNNFLITTSYSGAGRYIVGNYTTLSVWRYTLNNYLCQSEVLNKGPWDWESYAINPSSGYQYRTMYKVQPYTITSGSDKTIYPPCIARDLLEYIDPVAGIGYLRGNLVHLTAEEALLNRAEAYVVKEEYDKALADLNLWVKNTIVSRYAKTLTEETITAWRGAFDYYTPEAPTPIKRLNPTFFTLEDGSYKEAMLMAVLYLRRVEFGYQGMRWFDIKRYGIEIYRRVIDDFALVKTTGFLGKDDPRRALQIPQDVLAAGFEPNPR